MKTLPLIIASALLIDAASAISQSLDIAPGGYGLSIGNSRRITGIRVNLVDHQVERVTGLNLTLWTPKKNPDALFQGISLGLIGPKARQIDGIALGGIGVSVREKIRGIALGGLGVKAREITGLSTGLVRLEVEKRLRGLAIAGFWAGEAERLEGIAISPVGAIADTVLGVTLGGLIAGGGSQLTGIALSLGGSFSGRVRGIEIGGIGAGGGDLGGIIVGGIGAGGEQVKGLIFGGLFVGSGKNLDSVAGSLGGIWAKNRLRGIALGGLGVGAEEAIRGIAGGSLFVFSRDVKGVTAGALNGFILEDVNLEDFLRFRFINDRFTGLSIGLVNYTRRLKGVQIGLLNYAENNPKWLRLLPLVNLHL